MAKDKPGPPPKETTSEQPAPTPAQKQRYRELRASGKNPMEAKRIVLTETKTTGGARP